MRTTPKNMRLHIGIFGRRNVGKSSILNALCSQSVSLVSDVAGTTTDPVEKPMELLPLGPVLFIDTAGIDDNGILGNLRVEKTRQIFDRTDLGIIVTDSDHWGPYEQTLAAEFIAHHTPVLVVCNKSDLLPTTSLRTISGIPGNPEVLFVSAQTGEGVQRLREAMIQTAPDDFVHGMRIAADLVPPGSFAMLVVPIDKEAPKGRLILPQVQTIRDLLDNDSYCIVVKERELREALGKLTSPPALVITDSQAFLKVAADTPASVPMTSFSILFARFQADLAEMVRGATAIESLKPGDKVLVVEACTHHPIADDIGTVKIPRWLTQYVGGALAFTHIRGHDFPQDLMPYSLVIHCGACMANRREILSRIMHCRNAGVPVTNYGLSIAWSLGIFERALQPFPAALDVFHQTSRKLK
jgi:[FeFe] hydrogenase H-cluster maturation GTPase HydF